MLKVLSRHAQGRLRFLDASHIKVHQDGSNAAGGQQNQAIGQPKGRLNTKVTAWVDGLGRAVSLSLAPGQHADVCVAQTSPRPNLRGLITVERAKAIESSFHRKTCKSQHTTLTFNVGLGKIGSQRSEFAPASANGLRWDKRYRVPIFAQFGWKPLAFALVLPGSGLL